MSKLWFLAKLRLKAKNGFRAKTGAQELIRCLNNKRVARGTLYWKFTE